MKRKLINELDREMIIGAIKRLQLSKSYTVEITEKKIRRSLSQNALLWLWVTCISFETGNNKDYLHDYFKEKYLQPEAYEIFGEKKKRYTTTNLNTTQFKYYLDQIQIFASSELSITLPDPKDQKWADFYEYYKDKI